jgi:Holliday junction resolvase-like predicted endonuclease
MERGYELAERNYRTRFGELDLILRHANTLMKVHGTKPSPSTPRTSKEPSGASLRRSKRRKRVYARDFRFYSREICIVDTQYTGMLGL